MPILSLSESIECVSRSIKTALDKMASFSSLVPRPSSFTPPVTIAPRIPYKVKMRTAKAEMYRLEGSVPSTSSHTCGASPTRFR